MSKFRDPGADKRMQEFESSLRGVMQEKPKKKEPSACGQGSCSSKYIRDYK